MLPSSRPHFLAAPNIPTEKNKIKRGNRRLVAIHIHVFVVPFLTQSSSRPSVILQRRLSPHFSLMVALFISAVTSGSRVTTLTPTHWGLDTLKQTTLLLLTKAKYDSSSDDFKDNQMLLNNELPYFLNCFCVCLDDNDWCFFCDNSQILCQLCLINYL